MGIIAVAGGAGQVGKAITDGLVSDNKHKIYVLSRKDQSPIDSLSFVAMDYANVDGMARKLDELQIDTVICAIGTLTAAASQVQINLIHAADKAAATRRFVMASFDMLHRQEHIELNPLAKHTFDAIEVLEKSNLEYTRVANGWFIDYYGMPHYQTTLHPWINIVDLANKWAVIPGDATTMATFITTRDLGRFVSRMMELPTWSKITTIVGNEMTFGDLVKLAEEVRGCKFEVANDSLETLFAGKISFASRFPPIGLGIKEDEAFIAKVHYLAGCGHYRVPDMGSLNSRFPDIKLTTMREVMVFAWGSSSSREKSDTAS
ncbi:hypothetical protein PFICI_11070 [Pestalotiopsis fici W106-1]|uniref:NmrA-like domain-containing protein n=1 Tax=Pestalotiopsis fici (strain W106-1 / CGMCC3.15140) TaxID=1229662 RepID=W3WWG4_PESFW|nr:uncharacterized protein PFICI_11070 [Pestalotiopsis fici W106-1]ETS77196.1 hypothetical protein PFICI_11070 [Pestalotiopsis fici W106-1]